MRHFCVLSGDTITPPAGCLFRRRALIATALDQKGKTRIATLDLMAASRPVGI